MAKKPKTNKNVNTWGYKWEPLSLEAFAEAVRVFKEKYGHKDFLLYVPPEEYFKAMEITFPRNIVVLMPHLIPNGWFLARQVLLTHGVDNNSERVRPKGKS